MFSYSKIISTSLLALMIMSMIGCGGSSVDGGEELLTCDAPLVLNPAGNACVEPQPLQCPAPLVPNEFNDQCVVGADPDAPEPSVFPGENEAILFYNRPQDATNNPDDPVYDGYVLHTWNNEECDSYAAPYDSSVWGEEHEITGIDPNYGAYWLINLKEDYADCGNFIIHIGTDDGGKELGGGDWQMNLAQDDETFTRMNFTLSGYPGVFEFPILSLGDLPLQINDAAAHWIDSTTLVWNIDSSIANEVRLHHSATAGIEAGEDSTLSGTTITLAATALTDAQIAAYPLVADWAAFSIDISPQEAKTVLKNELVLAAYDNEGNAFSATHVQAAKVLDDLYTKNENDADEAMLGVVYSDAEITANLWAPTAQNVKLNVYSADKSLTTSYQMQENTETGIWQFVGDGQLDRQFYRYEITVYHPQNNAIETIESTDPYSVSLSTNGEYSQFVNLTDSDLKPEGWDGHAVPTIQDPEDSVIYEGHIRDFSAHDMSTSVENRGKYLAFTESDSVPVQHLLSLVESGLTHFQLLPVNDIASINEAPDRIVDLNHTVAELCEVNQNSPVCGVENDSASLLSVLESYQTFSDDAQALVESMRGYDSFNWGYDPKHFNAPDGIYASNPDGVARIVELRAMIKALHDMGLRVNMDVVYNHTNSAGLWDNSVLDKVVPGYYQSLDLVSGAVLQSTCCNDTALEHRMMDKLMADSLKMWAEAYAIDGFRFDIMSHGSKAQMLAAREAVRNIDQDTYFYGEGWPRDSRGFENASQFNMAGTEIATFNDRLREGVRRAGLFNGDTSDGNMNDQDIVKLGMAGTLADYVLESHTGSVSTGSSYNPSAYAKDPADIINYVSKHDDNTLWDQLQFNLNIGMSLEDRVRVQNIAATIPLLSQGIPFLQLGGDLIRSKSMDRNTFDAGDWFNRVDFTKESNNWNVGLPLAQDNASNWETIVAISSNPNTQAGMSDIQFASEVFKEFLSIRRDSKLFRLTSAEDIIARVGFHNIGKNQQQGVIVMSIDDGTGLTDLDMTNDAIVVMVNATNSEQSHTVPTAAGFELHAALAGSNDGRVQTANFAAGDNEGTFTVPAYTTAVFTKPQGASQGEGLSAFATSGAPDVVPYGDTIGYLRGSMNGWGTANPFAYQGDGIYQVAIGLDANTEYEFKFASEDWAAINFGAAGSSEQVVIEGESKVLASPGDNLKFTPTSDATFIFEIDANESNAPVLRVFNEEPFVGTTVYLRGSLNGWGTSTPLSYLGGGIYQAVFNIDAAGSQEFKVASEDWSTVDFGSGESDNLVTEGVEKLLARGGANLTMDFTATGEYTFRFNASNLAEPTLSVHTTQMFGDTPVFLRGSLNGWGTGNEFNYQGNSVYTVDIELAPDNYEFKIASEDWSTVDLGAGADDTQVVLDEAKLLAPVGANMKIEITTGGIYQFVINGPDKSSPALMVKAL